jgi:hypothetical protein
VGPTANEIERHIARERGALDRDLNELQTRVQNATDWRWQVGSRPLVALGVALAGGFVAARMIRPSAHRGVSYPLYRESPQLISRARSVMLGFSMAMGLRRLTSFLRS